MAERKDMRIGRDGEGKYVVHIFKDDGKVEELKFTSVEHHDDTFILFDNNEKVRDLSAEDLSYRVRNILKNVPSLG